MFNQENLPTVKILSHFRNSKHLKINTKNLMDPILFSDTTALTNQKKKNSFASSGMAVLLLVGVLAVGCQNGQVNNSTAQNTSKDSSSAAPAQQMQSSTQAQPAADKTTMTAAEAEKNSLPAAKVSSGEEWENPVLNYKLTSDDNPTETMPANKSAADKGMSASQGFEDFLSRMNKAFEHSGMTKDESEGYYTIFHHAHLVNDQNSNLKKMGGNDNNGMSMDQLKQRLAIKKIDKNNLEVFYKSYSCGWNFYHDMLTVNPVDSVILSKKIIEAWSARRPC